MSRAYCLTCNEPVHATPSGTCPLGHPVTTHDHGPEPWVGFAGDEGHAGHRIDEPARVPMQRLDVDGRPAVPAGHATNGHHNGSLNGHGTSLGGGHGHTDPFPSAFGHRSSFAASDEPTAAPTERAPATGTAADDLAALLADALNGATEPPDTDVDDDHGDADRVAQAAHGDWDELTSLAAELQLGANAGDDGPAARPDVDAHPDVEEHPGVDDGEPHVDAASLDELLAELTGGLAAEPGPHQAPDTTEVPADLETPAELSDDHPPAPTWPDPTSVAPPTPAEDAPPGWDDVASAPPAPEPVDPWAEPTPGPAEAAPPTPPVDLTNFTARGTRVGDGGPGRTNKTRRWKR